MAQPANCKLCRTLSCETSGELFQNKEQMDIHVGTHRQQVRLITAAKSIAASEGFLQTCFPTESETESGLKQPAGSKTDACHQNKAPIKQLHDICQRLTEKNKIEDSAYCYECSRPVQYLHNNRNTRYSVLIDHACSHLDAPLFRCHICFHSTATRPAMSKHIRVTHKQSRIGAYDDFTFDHLEDVTATLKKCFGQETCKRQGTKDVQKRKYNRLAITNRWKSSALGDNKRSQRIQRCHRLLQQSKQSDGKIRCRQCSKSIVVVQGSRYLQGNKAIQHALTHSKMPIYACRLCSFAVHNLSMMAIHTKKSHDLTVTGNFENRLDDFREQVLDIVTKCFDWS